MSAPGSEMRPAGQGNRDGGRMHGDHDAASVRADPMFLRARSLMQEGQWRDAMDVLGALEKRYPDSEEVRGLCQFLSLRLSAEEGWSDGPSDRLGMLRVPAIRGLVIANVLLYLLLSVLCLLSVK